MYHAAAGSKANGTANTGTRLAPTKLCSTCCKNLAAREDHSYSIPLHTQQASKQSMQGHASTVTNDIGPKRDSAKERRWKAVVLNMHGSRPTKKAA
jgi:hypothetical protein